jgi:N-acetylglucosamine-6-phosphate deacetylase
MEIVAKHYRTGEPISVQVDGGHYLQFDELEVDDDYTLPWIAPSLVDIQVNGFAGIDFNRPPSFDGAWEQACCGLYEHGCTHFLATLVTRREEDYHELLEKWETQRAKFPGNCSGWHLEGPFLNPAPGYHGAHRPEWMRSSSISLLEAWQKATKNSVRLVTLAPEMDFPASLAFIRHAVKEEVRIAIGHSAAMGETLHESVQAGARCWTHLGNAVPSPMEKFDNVIFHALADEQLMASLIPDGHHVPPAAFQVMARILGERLLLTTDAMAGAGAKPGSYTLGDIEAKVGRDGLALHPQTGRPVGSTLSPFTGLFRAAELAGLPWETMWDAFSIRPARWLGLQHALKPGAEANFCLFYTEPKPLLQAVYANGVLM